jgi:ParB family transcriptional regulator, chromosome partitioning protein
MSGKAAMAEEARSRLGRGLASLIGDVGNESSAEQRPQAQRRIPTAALRPNARNPRHIFPNDELDELATSLRERGIIQPIAVRPIRGVADSYEIIAGERRWRAAQRAGLHEVPVVVIEATDEESLQLAIIENVQRSDLNPLEEAEGYRALIRDFSHSQDDVARMVGKSRSHVANMLRLQTLPDRVRDHLLSGRLSAGHARALVGHHDAERLADEIVANGFNVRQVEEIARQQSTRNGKGSGKSPKKSPDKSTDTLALEKQLSNALGLVVSIDHRGEGGVLSIRYRNLEQLDDLTERLSKKA